MTLVDALRRLAALQGFVLPADAADTIGEVGSSPLDRAVAVWPTLFPEGMVQQAIAADLSSERLPALIQLEDGRIGVMTRRTVAGALVDLGLPQDSELSELELTALKAIVLHTFPQTHTVHEERPKETARQLFWQAIRRRWRIFSEYALASFVANILALVASLFAMQVYDRVVPHVPYESAYSTLWVLASGVLFAAIIEFVLRYVRARLADVACKQIDDELAARFFSKAMAIRMDARPRSVGSFAAQLRDFESVRNTLTSTALFAVVDLPFSLVIILVIAALGGWIALIPASAIALALIVGLIAQYQLGPLSNKLVRESVQKNGLLIEAIDGAETMKTLGAQWWFDKKWGELNRLLSGLGVRIRNISNVATTASNTIQQYAYALMIVAGVYVIAKGEMTMGGLIACSILVGRSIAPVAMLPNLFVQWHHARESLTYLDAIMLMPSDIAEGSRPLVLHSIERDLKAERVEFGYAKDSPPALVIPQLEIKPGERVAVVGRAGSGKSSLLKVLSGLYRPAQGRIFLGGVDVSLLEPALVRERIGYLPQDVRLFSGTLRANLTLGMPAIDDAKVLAASRLTGLDRVIRSHALGLDLPIAEGGSGLSGGQRQQVGLTRVLLREPPVLLLDEPTASLDHNTEAEVMRNLAQYVGTSGRTLVLVTHKPALLAMVTRVIVLEAGTIALDGPRDAVLQKLGVRLISAPPQTPQVTQTQQQKPQA
jgi:ATP-binding cassette subfamily C protein LapB